MTSLSKISKRIKRIIEGGDFLRDNSIDYREIADTVRDVAHYLMKGRFYSLKAEGESTIPSQYVATFEDIPVQTVERRGKKYCYAELPAIPIELPMDLGVQRVVPHTQDPEESIAMIPIPRYFIDIYGGLRAEMIEGHIGYEVQRGKIYFTEKDGDTIDALQIDKVDIDIATISPNDVGLNDTFPAPPEMIEDIVKVTLERYGMSSQQAEIAIKRKTPNMQD